MARKAGVLPDTDILTRVLSKSRESVGWYDSELSRERERVLEYYNSKLPKRQSIGSSSYISTDVYDAVESMKSQLLEVFAGGDEIVQFDPDNDMSVEDCKAATAYARYVIFSQNNGYQLFNDIIHDSLTARVGVAKVTWEEKSDEQEESFEGLSLDDVHSLAAQDEVDELNAELDEETQTFSGTLLKKYDCSQVRIVVIPPEEFLISPRSPTIKMAAYTAHRTLKTKADMKEDGLDPKKVDQVHYDDGKGLDLSPEVIARNEQVETAQSLDNPIQPEMEQVVLYESYVRMQIDKSKGVRLYKVTHAGSVLFSCDEVDERPFFPYVPLPIPHLFYGNSFAARVIPTQNVSTVLTRAVLDHASMTVNPRWQVVNGGLMNPREMLDNRMGGLVNVRRPDTVSALQVPNLNPFVFEILQKVASDNEKSTGISSLSQGLNKDAISKQNSRGLVGDMVNLSTQRQKICARSFAYNFLAPLMLEVIRLVILNEKKKKVLEVSGSPINCSPADWTARTTCTVSMHLGYGEKDVAVQKHVEVYKQLSSDPALANMFSPQNRYNLIRDTLKLGGITGAANYITSPDKSQPIQPDPFKTRELDIKDKLATATLMTAQSTVTKAQRLAQIDVSKMSLAQAKLHVETLEKDREQNRKDLEVAARIDTADREMTLEESMPDTSRKAIVAPNP